MRPSPVIKAVVGFLLAFQHSIANDEAPSVVAPGSVNQCGKVPLEIKGGTPPYTITIQKADNPTGPALQSSAGMDKPDGLALPAGMSTGMVITFEVKDSKGQTTRSAQSIVSSSADCPQPPQDNAGKPDGAAAGSPTPPDGSAPGAPGGDPKNPSNGTPGNSNNGAPGNPTNGGTPSPPSPDNSAGGSTAPAPSPPDQPPNALNATAGSNSTAAAGSPGSGNLPPSNTTTTSSGNVNATMPVKAGSNNSTTTGNLNSTDTSGSLNSSATTPRPAYTPPKNNTSTINGNTKPGNNSSSVNNSSKPKPSESSRRHLNPLHFSLFISSLAGFLIT